MQPTAAGQRRPWEEEEHTVRDEFQLSTSCPLQVVKACALYVCGAFLSEAKRTSKGVEFGVLSCTLFRFLLRPANRHPDGVIK